MSAAAAASLFPRGGEHIQSIAHAASAVLAKDNFHALRRHILPCTLMRAGTSKGLFIHRRHLPAQPAEWRPHLVAALGSRANDASQLDGLGGGSSTTSKVAVVARSQRPDADVEWTFVQVAVGKESIDMTGTCGNISSGVGPFALDEGLVKGQPGSKKVGAPPRSSRSSSSRRRSTPAAAAVEERRRLTKTAAQMDIRIYNTNTNSIMVETVRLDADGNYLELGNHTIPGVPTPGSELRCAYQDPAGSMTGQLFPAGGQRKQTLAAAPAADLPLSIPFAVEATLIDAANPFVFINAATMPPLGGEGPTAEVQRGMQVEQVRRAAAVAMGLAPSLEAAAQTRGTPKAALLSPPDGGADIRVQAYSMGKPHPSFQLTGAICLASALCFPGTVAAELSGAAPSPQQQQQSSSRTERKVRVAHPKGVIDVGVELDAHGNVASCAVTRTARRLISGDVYYYV